MLSIVCVVLNNKYQFLDTIDSIIKNVSTYELIVIDGGSTDGLQCLIRKQYSKHIDFFLSEPDNGIYDAMNKGISHSTGSYIWFVNAGDIVIDNPLLYLDNFDKYIQPSILTFPVLLEHSSGSLFSYVGRLTHPHQGILYSRSCFIQLGSYVDYKLISDRVFYDKLIKNNIKKYVFDHPIVRFQSGGKSQQNTAYLLNLKEFLNNFIKRPSFIALYRVSESLTSYIFYLCKK